MKQQMHGKLELAVGQDPGLLSVVQGDGHASVNILRAGA